MSPPLLAPLLLAAVLLALPIRAQAETHAVTIRNGASETIRGIYFGGGESRLRRELPPGAEARITYSTSCRTDVRIAYASGRTEEHPGIEVCTDPRITAGQDGTPGTPMPASAQPASTTTQAASKPGAKVAAEATPAKAPPPVVPPWTGKSITKRFGGLD